MEKSYNHKLTADKIYQKWEKSGAFKPSGKGKPFTIILPPPNANGSLHTGHAMMVVQDVLTRYHRMRGDNTLWLPGADHAGFETQIVYEKKLEDEGMDRFSIPREKLYKDMYAFVQKNKAQMYDQLKKLGFSLDWSRERFTLDPKIVKIVYQTFKKLYDDGLVYRGERIINWCTYHQTSLSDLEVNSSERVDPLYYVKYQIEGEAGSVTVATTRPETIYADVAVAIHPNDPRAKQLKGKKVLNPLTKEPIPVIKDEAVDPEFGTGMVKITPAHDPLDFEIGERHGLPKPFVIDFSGKMTEMAGQLKGMRVKEGRIAAAGLLKDYDALEKVDEDYTHTVSRCYKCKSIIEPLIRPQWFVAMTKTGKLGKNLRNDAAGAVKGGKKVRFIPSQYEKIFDHWMENLRDWNISRQIVWGIQIPAWYCENCEKITVTMGEKPKICKYCGKTKLNQDPDVFDTWFSSGQWPFATLQSISKKDFETFYPTSVMETGYDIFFFWVARMIMLGLYITDKAPFADVYLHGLVRDKDRQKMSKSKGNVIDPLGMIDIYGADALRGTLIAGNSPGADVAISEEKIQGYRNFSNKLWNIARYILENPAQTLNTKKISAADRKYLKRTKDLHTQTTKLIEKFNFGFALQKVREFVWHEYADKYLEESKKSRNQKVLEETLEIILKDLHPFMPFVTEEIWSKFHKTPLITEKW